MTGRSSFGPIAATLAFACASACGGDGEIDLLGGSGGAAGTAGTAGAASGGAGGCGGCEADEVCDAPTGECTEPCSPAEPCTSSERSVCHPDREVCVECIGDGTCGGEHPRCALPAGECVECLTGADCGDPSHPVCNQEFQCSDD